MGGSTGGSAWSSGRSPSRSWSPVTSTGLAPRRVDLDPAPEWIGPEGPGVSADDRDRSRLSHSGRRSPLTDPRALGSSVLVHAALLLVGSLIVLGATLPSASRTAPKPLRAELGPVDNRAVIAGRAAARRAWSAAGDETESSPVNPDGPRGEPVGRRPAGRGDLADVRRRPPLAEGVRGLHGHRRPARPRHRRRRGRRGGLRRREREGERPRHRVLRRARAGGLLRLRDRLLRQHVHPQLAGRRQARADGQPRQAPARRPLRGRLLQPEGHRPARPRGPASA